ncbi:unnamed protein product, partial [Discosporangium mesarthrocarpum]
QVSSLARLGLDGFRSSLPPMGWLEMRGQMLERVTSVVDDLPTLAKSADERRLRAALDSLAGHLHLLRGDARVALDSMVGSVLRSLCQALEFDAEVNVQVLEAVDSALPVKKSGNNYERSGGVQGPAAGAAVGSREDGEVEHQVQWEERPMHYRQVLAHAHEDPTIRSAKRAIRLLGRHGDIYSIADAALTSLETPPPQPTNSLAQSGAPDSHRELWPHDPEHGLGSNDAGPRASRGGLIQHGFGVGNGVRLEWDGMGAGAGV